MSLGTLIFSFIIFARLTWYIREQSLWNFMLTTNGKSNSLSAGNRTRFDQLREHLVYQRLSVNHHCTLLSVFLKQFLVWSIVVVLHSAVTNALVRWKHFQSMIVYYRLLKEYMTQVLIGAHCSFTQPIIILLYLFSMNRWYLQDSLGSWESQPTPTRPLQSETRVFMFDHTQVLEPS